MGNHPPERAGDGRARSKLITTPLKPILRAPACSRPHVGQPAPAWFSRRCSLAPGVSARSGYRGGEGFRRPNSQKPALTDELPQNTAELIVHPPDRSEPRPETHRRTPPPAVY